jgi:molybdopterin synthase catalytic subunit
VHAWNPNVRVQREPFDADEETRRIATGRRDVGAVVAFTGYCRDEGGTLAALELEHYPGMAEAEIARIAAEASARWTLLGLTAVHRFGRILPGEPIVLVLAASAHRQAAFEAGLVRDGLPQDPRPILEEGSTAPTVRRAPGSQQRMRTRRAANLDP